ncbi:MAG: 50S ribosomal protein L4 [Betaproteobacteria bacterium]
MAEKKARKPKAESAGKPASPGRAGAAASEPQRPAEKAKASPTVTVVNPANQPVRELELASDVFAARPNTHLVYEAVKQHRAGARRGTHMTKNRALVSGSGKKPWRQKGTGRARAGETRNPLWRHGGTVFGPQPRDYAYAMPKKARAAALRAALSQRLREGALKVVEGLAVEQPKTKVLKGLLFRLGIVGKAVLVEHEPADALVLSGRNLPGVRVVADSRLTAYDVMDCKHLVLTPEALGKLAERLAPRAQE